MEHISVSIQALARSVLVQAMADLRRGQARYWRPQSHPAQVRAWFLDDDDTEMFSFGSVCAILGLRASRVRAELGLHEYEREQVK